VISRFKVRNGLEQDVREAFLNRPRMVENVPGFCALSVLTDATDPSIFLLLTRWTDAEAFHTWHRSDAHHHSHSFIPKGLKLDASFTQLTVGDNIEDPSGVQNLADAVEGRTVAMSGWLMESDAVFALLLAPDGTIRVRNRASWRVFGPDAAGKLSDSIWGYLGCADTEFLRAQLTDPAGPKGKLRRLNLVGGLGNPVTLEVGLVRSGGATLMLAAKEQLHDTTLEIELLKMTNDMSMLMRESARHNRELKKANETIERLARTDALTGLANRRTLDEAFQREFPRAERLHESLTIIVADLDHFKSINDKFGHIAGDQVLIATAATFGSQLRPYDLAARYGGEEFVMLLPATSIEEARDIAERIRADVTTIAVDSCPRQITISLGVASWIPGESQEHFVARADAALYRAKTRGRNCVEAATQYVGAAVQRGGRSDA
jgi:diguanylate cyclase (GGDEF)-like protein